MLALMVVRPSSPSAYASPGLSTPSAARRRSSGVHVTWSRRMRISRNRNIVLVSSCAARSRNGSTVSSACLLMTVPNPQQAVAPTSMRAGRTLRRADKAVLFSSRSEFGRTALWERQLETGSSPSQQAYEGTRARCVAYLLIRMF